MENEKTVTIGSLVTIKEGKQKSEKFLVVGINEGTSSEGKISNNSPIGKALMRRRAGEKVTAKTPGGMITLLILDIE